MKKAIGYMRISIEDEGSLSLDYQEAAIREYAERTGLMLFRIEADNGISGKSINNRPGIQAILQAVEQQECDCVIVFKSDRMSRDGIESLQIENLMLRKGIEYLSVTEGNLAADSVDDEFMRFIRAGLNQRERKVISLRTRAALQRKRQKGERLGRPRYGWKVENGELIPVPTEQEAIARMRALRQKGYSTREIAKALADEGYRTRTRRKFNQTEVCRILRAA